jgi:hypothetical protein
MDFKMYENNNDRYTTCNVRNHTDQHVYSDLKSADDIYSEPDHEVNKGKFISTNHNDVKVSVLRRRYKYTCSQQYMMIYFGCFHATFNNISAISWRAVLVVEEAGVPGENHRPWASN